MVGGGGLDRLQQRACDQVLPAHYVLRGGVRPLPTGFEQPDGHHLPGIVPLVERLAHVETLVALKSDQLGVGE